MNDVAVRPARVDDAAAIAELQVAGWRGAFDGVVDAQFLAELDVDQRARSWSRAIAEPSSGRGIRIAVHDRRAVGFCSFGPSRDDDVHERTGEIYAIYIDLDLRGTGIGRALMIGALAGLREGGFERVTLWTLEQNSIGRSFYDRSGWSLDGCTERDPDRAGRSDDIAVLSDA